MLYSTIMVITNSGINLHNILLIIFNIALILIVSVFCFIINKESKLIKKYLRKLNRSKDNDVIDILFDVSDKHKFIRDAEQHIINNMEKKYALVHYDINKFTIINNMVGHKTGDEILRQISKSLRKNLKNEFIGKNEGDNFFTLLGYGEQEELIGKACMLSEKIESLSIWNKMNINPAVITGIYIIDNNELDIRTAIDKAYFAKLMLKNNYKSGYAVYDKKIENSLIETKKLEDDMNKALEEKQFKVFLQPKVDLKTGLISGAEALVRWNHPELGLLSPDRFIHIFEKNGFIVKLDKFVFEQVCINMSNWSSLGYDIVPVSVNVSRIHFLNSNFVLEYNKIKEKYKIARHLIEIEITESVVFNNDNENEVFNVMRKFRDGGFEISMDDFGSGYSCLGLLKEMPIDTIKLDRMFLKNIEEYNSQIIVSNIVNLAKNLNLNVVSEGVETSKQIEFLKGIGCDMAQGYVFSKPEPMEVFEKSINKGKINYYEALI
ncbi:MAG: putative bifunctional diguanylate cyclase/phosphodiesterase [Sedimentibacter sp.]